MAKQIVVISLGGTISMTEAATGGIVPTLSGEELVRRFGLSDPSIEVSALSLRQLASAQLTPNDLAAVAAKTHELAASGAAGIVVTQGTDTIEETAFALDLIGTKEIPVVVTGAMRHPNAPGSDGAANFRDAATVAVAAPSGLGATVVMDGEIHAARYLIKGITSTVRAFFSSPIGQVGWVQEGGVFLSTRELEPRLPQIPVPAGPAPDVAVLKAALGDDGRLVPHLPELGYAGLIVEGMGGGHVHPSMADRLEELATRLPIVISTRVLGSHVLRDTYGFVGSEIDLKRRGIMLGGWLTSGKLQLMLSFLLAAGANQQQIREALEPFGGF